MGIIHKSDIKDFKKLNSCPLALNYMTLMLIEVKEGKYSLRKELYLANPKSAIFRTALSSFEDIRRFCLENKIHQILNAASGHVRLEIKCT